MTADPTPRPTRVCRLPGCPNPAVRAGRCAAHVQQADRSRAESRTLDYSRLWWRRWRLRFIGLLVEQGITPVCGAALPDGPDAAAFSRCKRDLLLTFASDDGSSLHVDHSPPLRPGEQANRAAVCDPRRCALLCAACHGAKTAREIRGGKASARRDGLSKAHPGDDARGRTEQNAVSEGMAE